MSRQQEARARAADVLRRSRTFQQLAPERQAQVMADTDKVIGYLADAGAGEALGLLPHPSSATQSTGARSLATGGQPSDADFTRGMSEAFTDTIRQVDFPGFVAELIQGVFQAVVDSSIQQMEAYAELISNVSKSVDQYMKDNISEEQGRDYLLDQYPDHLQADLQNNRVVPKDDANSDNGPDFLADLGLPFSFDDMDDEENEQQLVTAARRKMSMDRQQLLLGIVGMGLQRIVVTKGQIKAGVQFDLNVETLSKRHFDRQTGFEYNRETKYKSKRKGFWFIKPKRSYERESTLNITTDTNTENDDEQSSETKVKLTGNVDLQFKSDYFPLEKMTELMGFDQQALDAKTKGQAPPSTTPNAPSLPVPPLPGS
ncbi:MAG: hypothetical protein AAF576_05800 [Pseudomonadota bacterium]